MSKPMIRIHNVETDEVVDREMTDVEYENFLAENVKSQEAQQKRITALAKLTALGLTSDDLKALGLGGN